MPICDCTGRCGDWPFTCDGKRPLVVIETTPRGGDSEMRRRWNEAMNREANRPEPRREPWMVPGALADIVLRKPVQIDLAGPATGWTRVTVDRVTNRVRIRVPAGSSKREG